MGSRQAKEIRKQAMKEVGAEMNARLDKIEAFCQDSLNKQEKRARSVQSWIIQEVSVKIQNDLFNASCTLDAVVEVLAEAGINVPDFAAKVDTKKVEVAERKKREAEEKMKAQIEAANKAKADLEAKAAEQQAAPVQADTPAPTA